LQLIHTKNYGTDKIAAVQRLHIMREQFCELRNSLGIHFSDNGPATVKTKYTPKFTTAYSRFGNAAITIPYLSHQKFKPLN